MKKCMKLTIFTIFIFLFSFLNVSAEENVELIKVELKEKSEYVEINEEVSLEGNKIISNVNFFDEGDYVIYKFTIKNNDDRDYKIKDIFDDNESEYLDFEYTYDEDILAKEEKEVLLKITYKSQLPYDAVLTPTNEFNSVNEISVSVELEEIINNPSTFDNAKIYLIIEVIGVTSLLVIFVKLKKKNAILLLILTLLLIPRNTNAKIDFKINFTFKNTMNMKVNYLDNNWKSKVSGTYSKIEFIKTLEIPDGAVDVSQEEDESIKAWIEEGTVYIGSRYKVFFPVDSSSLFSKNDLVEIKFNDRIDTTFVTNMSKMFSYDINLVSLDVTSFRTGNVTNMEGIFEYNVKIESLDVSNFNTKNVTTMKSMFDHLVALKTIDVSNFDTSKVTNMEKMFCYNTMIETIDVSNFDTSNVTIMDSFLDTCPKLKYANLDNIHLLDQYMYNFLRNNVELKEVSLKNAVVNFKVYSNLYYYFTGTTGDSGVRIEKIDVSNWDLSNATNLSELFQNFKYLKEIVGLNTWDTSTITNMYSMFRDTAYLADSINLEISNWDISNVTSMSYMFYDFGYVAKEVTLNISNWTNNKVQSIDSAFRFIGYASNKVDVILNDVEISGATNISYMFYSIGYNGKEVNIDIDDLNLDGATRLELLFSYVGYNAKNVNIDVTNFSADTISTISGIFESTGDKTDSLKINLTNFSFANLVRANQLFYYAGSYSKDVELNISHWETPKIENMNTFFYAFGERATIVNIKVEDIDTSSLTSAEGMFRYVGENSEKVKVEGMNEIDFSNVTNMSFFFNYIGYASTASNLEVDLGTINVYSSNIKSLISYVPKVKIIINLYEKPTNFADAFNNAATLEGSEIIVNYTSKVDNIDDIIATRSENSNIVKGELIEE